MEATVELNPVPQKSKKQKFKEFYYNQKGWLFMVPALILLLIFTFYPIVNTVIDSFKNGYEGLSGAYDGWGFQNYIKVSQYKNFSRILSNTLLFAFISVPISTLLALLISVWLNSIKWIQKAYQTILFLPYLTNALAIGAVFAAMFNVIGGTNIDGNIIDPTSVGLINTVLGWFGIDPVNWINVGSNVWANRFVVILYEVWAALPFKILILFSALQSVNKQYYQAAKIDGAGRFKTLWRVTVPLISPMISYLVVTGFIGGFKEYTAIVGIFGTNMGPYDSEMNTMVGFIYDRIADGRTGLASAGALILFAIIFVFTLLNLWFSKRRVHY